MPEKEKSRSKSKDKSKAKDKDKDAASPKKKSSKSSKAGDKSEKGGRSSSKGGGKSKKSVRLDEESKIIDESQAAPQSPQPSEGVPRGFSSGALSPSAVHATFGPPPQPLCKLHSKPLTLYCVNREEPCCQDCTVMGPFNTPLYRVCTVTEAFNRHFAAMEQTANSQLLQKREQLVAQMARVEYRLDEVSTTYNLINRDIQVEYQAVHGRLEQAFNKKKALLQYQLDLVFEDTRKVDEILSVLKNYRQPYNLQSFGHMGGGGGELLQGGDPLMLQFLLDYRRLNVALEHSLTKTINTAIDVTVTDFPRELALRRARDEKIHKLQEMLDAKDELIWDLVQQVKHLQAGASAAANQEVMDEMNRWMTLCDRYAQELKHAGPARTRGDSPPPRAGALNQSSSFAAPPAAAEDLSAVSSGSMPVIPVELLREHPDLQNALLSIKQSVANGLALEDEFKLHDTEASGKVPRVVFENTLLQVFALEPGVLHTLSGLLSPDYVDTISYTDFLALVRTFRGLPPSKTLHTASGGQLSSFDRVNTGRSTMAEGSQHPQQLMFDEQIALHKRVCYLLNVKGIRLKSELLSIDLDSDCRPPLTHSFLRHAHRRPAAPLLHLPQARHQRLRGRLSPQLHEHHARLQGQHRRLCRPLRLLLTSALLPPARPPALPADTLSY